MKWHEFKTQKARGLAYLCTHTGYLGFLGKPGMMPMLGYDGWSGAREIRVFPYDYSAFTNLPIFARPCPTVPRHGFVDSRFVSSVAEVAALVAQTYKEEKEAEIITMPRLEGQYSAVLSPSSLVLGTGNDGATSGHGVLLSVPLPLPNLHRWNLAYSGKAEYGTKEAPEHIYLEAVEHDGRMVLVQARPGPVTETGLADYVPRDMVVEVVYKLNESWSPSLLQWEGMVKGWKEEKGLVVWAPGSSLTSHFAVHCIQNGVPFITRKEEPKEGEKLEKQAPPKFTKVGRDRFAREMEKRLKEKLYFDQGKDVKHGIASSFALATAHAHSVWGNDTFLVKLRVRALIHLLRYAAVACIGEARHFCTSGPGRPTDPNDPRAVEYKTVSIEHARKPTLPWEILHPAAPKTLVEIHPDRASVYNVAFKHSLEALMDWVVLAAQDLAQPGWREGMGGDKWASSARVCRETWDALQLFLAQPDKKNWRRLCQKWNELAFAVHNGGGLLNKWCGVVLDTMSRFPGVGLLGAYPILLQEKSGVEAGEVKDIVEDVEAFLSTPSEEEEEEIDPLHVLTENGEQK